MRPVLGAVEFKVTRYGAPLVRTRGARTETKHYRPRRNPPDRQVNVPAGGHQYTLPPLTRVANRTGRCAATPRRGVTRVTDEMHLARQHLADAHRCAALPMPISYRPSTSCTPWTYPSDSCSCSRTRSPRGQEGSARGRREGGESEAWGRRDGGGEEIRARRDDGECEVRERVVGGDREA